MDSVQIAEHLAYSIKQGELIEIPFPHLRMSNCFDRKVYDTLLQYLPESRLYRPLKHRDAKTEDGVWTRGVFELEKSNIRRLTVARRRFWEGITNALTNSIVKNSLFDRLHVSIERRFGETDAKSIRGSVVPKPALFRDTVGYKIRPHCDISAKVITFQIYLPIDHEQMGLGTSLYEKKNQAIELVDRIPFFPNSAYAFVPSDVSLHGREMLTQEDGDRDTLMLICYESKNGF